MREAKENLLPLRKVKIFPPAPSKTRGQGEAREKEREKETVFKSHHYNLFSSPSIKGDVTE